MTTTHTHEAAQAAAEAAREAEAEAFRLGEVAARTTGTARAAALEDARTAAEAAQAAAEAARTAARTHTARVDGVLTADVLARVDRAASALGGTMLRYGATADDAASDVVGDLLAEAMAGRPIDTTTAALAGRVRRTVRAYRTRAERERPTCMTAAEMVDGPQEAADADGDATDARRRAAILGRRQHNQSVDHADVLAVSEAARIAMRPAEVTYLRGADRAAMLAALEADYRPEREAEADAWAAMLATVGGGTRAAYAVRRPTVAFGPLVDGRLPVIVTMGRPLASRPERRQLRRDERAARAFRDAAERAAAMTADGPAALRDASADTARAARSEWKAAALAIEHAAPRTARYGAARDAATAERPVPGGGAADALTAGYRPEILSVYSTAARPRGSVMSGRSVKWAAVLPEATAARRAALGRAARRWAAAVTTAAAEAAEADAWAAIVRRERADAVADGRWVVLAERAAADAAAAREADALTLATERGYFADGGPWAARMTRRAAARDRAAAERVDAWAATIADAYETAFAWTTARDASLAIAAWIAAAERRPAAERPAALTPIAAHAARMADAVCDAARMAEADAARAARTMTA